MPIWRVICPNCGTENQVTKDSVEVRCSIVECRCICSNCQNEFFKQQEYWRWLGLDQGPSIESRTTVG